MLDARSFFLADWKSLCSVAAAAAHTSENDGTIVLSQSAALTEDREINMCNPKMPRQLDAHLELENAESNFCLFSEGSSLVPELHSNDSEDERKDTWSGRRSNRYPPGFRNTRGQRVERLIGGKPKITCSLSRDVWPCHWHSTWLDWSNSNTYRCQIGAVLDVELLLSLFELYPFYLLILNWHALLWLVYRACLNCCEIVICFCPSCWEENVYRYYTSL